MRIHRRHARYYSPSNIPESDLAKLHGPIGIDLGGQTPEEIALAVMAEIVAVRDGRPVVYSSSE